MKVYKYFWFILTMLLLIGCKSTQKNAEEIESISLSRSGCYGTCPIYTASFNETGSFNYEGKMFVENKGCYIVKGNYDFNYLKSLVNLSDFYNLEDNYLSNTTDIPTITLSVKIGSNLKTIRFNEEIPQELRRIQVELDSIIKNSKQEDWSRTSETY